MKTLFILRHAKSSWKDLSLSDHDRPLNKRGIHNAPFIASVLLKTGYPIEKIMSSSAKRAYETANYFAEALQIEPEDVVLNKKLYEASAMKIGSAILNLPAEINSALIVGHNPGLEEFLREYTSWDEEYLPTCGLVGLRFEGEWSKIFEKNAVSFFYEYPRKYFPKQD